MAANAVVSVTVLGDGCLICVVLVMGLVLRVCIVNTYGWDRCHTILSMYQRKPTVHFPPHHHRANSVCDA